MVFVDRTDLTQVTPPMAEAFVWQALRRATQSADLGDSNTEKLLARSLTLQPVDLVQEGLDRSRHLQETAERARREAEAAAARRVPALLTEAKLDALVAVYERDLERRGSLVVLGWYGRAAWRRWRWKRQARRA